MRDSRAAWGPIILLLATLPIVPFTGAQSSKGQLCAVEPCGPNLDEVIYSVFPLLGYDKEEADLRNHQVDMIPNIRSINDAERLTADPNITVYRSPGGSSNVVSLFFNCRRPPLDDVLFRTAFSRLTDRKYITDVLLKGWAEPSTTFVPAFSDEWTNFNASVPQFSFVNATRMLENAGYVLDSRTGARSDPKTGKPLRPITILTPERVRNPALWAAGEVVAYYAKVAGIQATHTVLPDHQIVTKTMKDRNFDIVITDVAFAAAPFGLYAYFHSSQDKDWTFAYSGIHDLTLDKALEDLWFGTTKSEAMGGAQTAQARLASLIPYVPIYSTPNLAAVSSEWEGVINMRGYGAVNPSTYVSLHKAGELFSGKFTQSVEGSFATLNPLLANQTREWSVLELLYSPLFAADPSTSRDLPVLAEDWTTEAWSNGAGKEGMKITFKLREDVMWQDGQPFTSEDVKFTIEYLQSNKVPRYAAVWSALTRVEAPDSATVQIYLSDTGYRHIYEFAWMIFLPEHIWNKVEDYKTFKPWEEPNPTVKGLTKLVGQGPFIFAQADLKKYIKLVWNPLYFAKNPQKPGLLERQSAPSTATAGETVTVQYNVLSFTRQPIADPDAGFQLRVKRSDGTIVLDLPSSYTDRAYEAKLDTRTFGAGDYVCEFRAAPYGIDTFTITVNPSQAMSAGQPSYLYGIAVAAVAVLMVCIYLVAKKNSRKKRA